MCHASSFALTLPVDLTVSVWVCVRKKEKRKGGRERGRKRETGKREFLICAIGNMRASSQLKD